MSARFISLMNMSVDEINKNIASCNEVIDYIRLNNGIDVMHIVAECKEEIDEYMFVLMMKMKE